MVQMHCFIDHRQDQYLRPYDALSLELLVLTSENLDQQFIAALQWIYMSKTRRRCKAAVMGLYELALTKFKPTRRFGVKIPTRLYPSEQLYSITSLVKMVKIFSLISCCFLK
jgi:hypothetical protein